MCVSCSLLLRKIIRPVSPVSGSHFEYDSKVHSDLWGLWADWISFHSESNDLGSAGQPALDSAEAESSSVRCCPLGGVGGLGSRCGPAETAWQGQEPGGRRGLWTAWLFQLPAESQTPDRWPKQRLSLRPRSGTRAPLAQEPVSLSSGTRVPWAGVRALLGSVIPGARALL